MKIEPGIGTKVVEGDTVTLIVPDIITEYPSFTDGTWEIEDVKAFADEYELIFSIV